MACDRPCSLPLAVGFLALLALAHPPRATAQAPASPVPANTAYVEARGVGGLVTVNYAHRFGNADFRIGGAIIPLVGGEAVLMPHVLAGRRKQIEIGLGVLAFMPAQGEPQQYLTGEVAYRFDLGVRKSLRVSLVHSSAWSDAVVPGVSFGWNF